MTTTKGTEPKMKYIYDWSFHAANMATAKVGEPNMKYFYNWSFQAANKTITKGRYINDCSLLVAYIITT